MMPLRSTVLLFALAACTLVQSKPAELITYNTLPLGSTEAPFLLRTYFPDPDLDDAVFAHHHRGDRSPKYNPTKGEDIQGQYEPIKGIPAAIGVNHGPELSYVFDTTEGRLMYAWKGGFVDMFPYWGDQNGGNRLAYDYIPRLVGTLFYKTSGQNPVEIDGKSVSELGAPRFVGYDLVKRQPVFLVRFGGHTVRTRVQPLPQKLGLQLEISVEPAAALSYRNEDPRYVLQQEKTTDGVLHVTLTGVALGSFEGYPRKLNFTTASVAVGEQLYNNYGCAVCHSLDGSASHGPTWAGLFERERPLVDGSMVKADEAYLLESIKAPNAKIAKGFAPNLMPTYPLKELEYEALLLFIKSLRQPE